MTRLRSALSLVLCLAACATPERAPARSSASTSSAPGASASVPASTVSALEHVILSDVLGSEHDLGATRGPIALVFWQTWCASCRAEAPTVVAAAKAHPNVRFFGVVPGSDEDVDDAQVRDVARELGLTYPSLRDRDLVLTTTFDVKGTPTIVMLNSDGQVVHKGKGLPADWSIVEAK